MQIRRSIQFYALYITRDKPTPSRRDAVAGRASVTVELEFATFVEQIEITNAGSSFVQVFLDSKERNNHKVYTIYILHRFKKHRRVGE